MKQIFLKAIPKTLKDLIQNSKLYEKLRAKKYPLNLASTSKRLDICSAQFSHILHLSNCPSLKGKICLEIGSGYVLSHALICHLLGAKKVIATDIFRCASPETLDKAVHESIISIIRDILSPFEQHTLLRARLEHLLSIKYFDFNVLKELGIEYIAPIDLAREMLDDSVDFIFSNSVLEHVPCEDVPLLLGNIYESLKPGGTMIHCIHLEDHKNFSSNPFEFLQIGFNQYSRSLQSSRGNRIRKSGWLEEFGKLTSATNEIIYEWNRVDKDLPDHIDESIHYKDQADLRISHLGIYTKKGAN